MKIKERKIYGEGRRGISTSNKKSVAAIISPSNSKILFS